MKLKRCHKDPCILLDVTFTDGFLLYALNIVELLPQHMLQLRHPRSIPVPAKDRQQLPVLHLSYQKKRSKSKSKSWPALNDLQCHY